ncbi:MAG: hypothetical protein IPP71_05655 [Bacteroidetes bacterium]|nr:hypothetical protein [Bacteroidota bacterium]
MKKQKLHWEAVKAPAILKTIFLQQNYKILLTILLTSIFTYGKAQAPLDAAVSFSGNQGYFKVMVPDTNDISEIEMLVGTEDNASEMFSLYLLMIKHQVYHQDYHIHVPVMKSM